MKKILLIEDDSFLVDIYVTKLEEKKFKVDAVRSGEEGLDLLKKNKFDLVVLDLSLPGIDGWQVLEEMRKNRKTKKTKVLIFSNHEIKERAKLEKLDAQGYLIKINYTPDEIVREIKEILS